MTNPTEAIKARLDRLREDLNNAEKLKQAVLNCWQDEVRTKNLVGLQRHIGSYADQLATDLERLLRVGAVMEHALENIIYDANPAHNYRRTATSALDLVTKILEGDV